MTLVPRSTGLTDVGRVRKHNEDSYLIDDALGLYVVADGMGGHAGGEVASAEAIDQIHTMVRNAAPALLALRERRSPETLAPVRRAVEAAIQAATYMVFGIAEQDPAHKGMGTTISCLLVVGDTALVGQVGDSRVYLIRSGTPPLQITEDHTLVNMQLKSGAITAEEAKTARYQNLITRAVGVKDYVEVDVFDMECQPNDRFILCSDGVHGYLKEGDLDDLCVAPERETCNRLLIAHALEGGGKDNATVITVDMVAANAIS